MAEGELLIDDEPAADTEQGGAGDDLENQESRDLAHEDFEVSATGFEVGASQVIGTIGGELVAARAFEETGAAGDFLEPTHDTVFAEGLGDAGSDGTPSEDKNDEGEEGEENEAEGEEERMVEAKHDHPDDRAEYQIDSGEEEEGGVFLHRHHIEEAVDEFRGVDAIDGAQVDSGDSVGEVGGHADEKPALDDFDDVVLESSESGGD